jgi:hypothetical protein
MTLMIQENPMSKTGKKISFSVLKSAVYPSGNLIKLKRETMSVILHMEKERAELLDAVLRLQ